MENQTSVFLGSASKYHKTDKVFWAHTKVAMNASIGPPKGRILFVEVANAEQDYAGYTKTVSKALSDFGYEVVGLHSYLDPEDCLFDESISCVGIGGGNTHLLAEYFHDRRMELMIPLKQKVMSGKWKYFGYSAGSVFAGKSTKTTNDMSPIENPSTEGLGLVPFLINAHYVPGPLLPKHSGETREERILQVLLYDSIAKVVGLPEGNWITGQGGEYILGGDDVAMKFRLSEEGKLEAAIWATGKSYHECEIWMPYKL